MNSLFQNAPQIIEAAAKSTLGLVALMIFFLGILSLVFFRKESVKTKLGIFAAIFLGIVFFCIAFIKATPEIIARSSESVISSVIAPQEQIVDAKQVVQNENLLASPGKTEDLISKEAVKKGTLTIELKEGFGNQETNEDKGFKIKLTNLEILKNGNVKAYILHTSLKDGYTIALFQPNTYTYFTDEEGNQYSMIEAENVVTLDERDTMAQRTRFPQDVPIKYTITFSPFKHKPKTLNFVAKYFGGKDRGCCFYYEAIITNIEVK